MSHRERERVTMTNQRRGIESGPEDGRVMTEEQIEVLRHQIACYAAICERLVQTHRDLATIQQDSLTPPGMRLGGPYYDPFTIPKTASRQRWTPTPAQLHILENLFEQGIGTPSKANIKEITLELSQNGQISEGNVYNWFQNRRARSKRRLGVALPNNSESEVDTVFESQNKMKAKLKKALPHDELPLTTDHLSLHGTETSSEVHYFNQETKQTQGTEQLVGNMEIPESFASFCLGKSYNMEG